MRKLLSIFVVALLCSLTQMGQAHAEDPAYDHASDVYEITEEHAPDGEVIEEHGDEHADAHGGEHEKGGLPQLDAAWYPSQLFWLVLTFVIMYFSFSRKILPDLSSALENRRELIEGDLDTAQKLKEEAEKVHKAYEEILDEARSNASGMFANVEQAIKEKAAEQSQAFRAKAEKANQETEKRIEAAKKDVMDDMNTIAAEIASEAAKKIVGISTDIKQAKTVIQNISKKAA